MQTFIHSLRIFAQQSPVASPEVSSAVLPENYWLVSGITAAVAVILLLIALRARRNKHLVDDLPTSKVEGVFIGLVELKGTAEVESPLTSHLDPTRCVQYEWKVEERWRKQERETYTDKDGKRRTRTKTSSGWTTVASGRDATSFYLRDDTGVILVHPDGAKIEPVTWFSRTCRRRDPLYYGKGPRREIAHSTGERRFVETGIPLHRELYMVGKARERQDIVAPEIAHDPDARMFLISTRGAEKVSRGFALTWWLCSLGGLILLSGVQAFLWHEHPDWLQRAVRHGWYWPLIFALLWFIGWLTVTFNSIVCVRQRMKRAWSTVDVELKRRATLLPQLVNILNALKDHERKVQETVTELRAQTNATEPGEEGEDPHGCIAPLRAVAEDYPEIKSQENFQSLFSELSRTEQRIALARGYFNEVCTFYNNRLATFPDMLLAKAGGFKPHPLIGAGEFERAPVEVNLAD